MARTRRIPHAPPQLVVQGNPSCDHLLPRRILIGMETFSRQSLLESAPFAAKVLQMALDSEARGGTILEGDPRTIQSLLAHHALNGERRSAVSQAIGTLTSSTNDRDLAAAAEVFVSTLFPSAVDERPAQPRGPIELLADWFTRHPAVRIALFTVYYVLCAVIGIAIFFKFIL